MTFYSAKRFSELKVFAPLAYACVCFSALRAIIPLGWYPSVFVDEPFFSISAIRLLKGESFAYVVHSGAPWSGEVWGYHSPFTFRLFLLPLMAFSNSLFACRFLPCILAHLAIFLIARWLVREMRSPLGALLFSLAWCFGFSFFQISWARPEGIALFFLTLGFLELYRGLSTGCRPAFFLAGTALGCAVGCSICCIWFCIAAALLALAVPYALKQSHPTHLVVLGLGGMLAASLFVASWFPDISKCWDQFWWFVSLHKHSWEDIREAVSHVLFGGFGLRSLWFLGLGLYLLAIIAYGILHARKAASWYRSGHSRYALPFIMVTAFSLSGVVVFVSSSLQYYYLVYVEVWATLLLSMALTTGRTFFRAERERLPWLC